MRLQSVPGPPFITLCFFTPLAAHLPPVLVPGNNGDRDLYRVGCGGRALRKEAHSQKWFVGHLKAPPLH